VIQLLKEAGVDLPADVNGIVSGKASEAAAPGTDNLDFVHVPATFDYEGDETAWCQGRPPGEVELHMSDLELSDSDSSVVSILGVCLDGFDGDAWMSDAEGAHDDIQVGQTAGVNDPGDIPWRTTAWRSRVKDVITAAVPSDTVLSIDRQGGALTGNDANGKRPGGVTMKMETTWMEST